MILFCKKCDQVLKEGEPVRVTVESTYHSIKSSISYALDKANLVADSSTLEHVSCHPGD